MFVPRMDLRNMEPKRTIHVRPHLRFENQGRKALLETTRNLQSVTIDRKMTLPLRIIFSHLFQALTANFWLVNLILNDEVCLTSVCILRYDWFSGDRIPFSLSFPLGFHFFVLLLCSLTVLPVIFRAMLGGISRRTLHVNDAKAYIFTNCNQLTRKNVKFANVIHAEPAETEENWPTRWALYFSI